MKLQSRDLNLCLTSKPLAFKPQCWWLPCESIWFFLTTFSLGLLKSSRIFLFIAVLFTIGGTWKQPKHPLTDEWIKKMWYIYMMEYYSAIKRNKTGSFAVTWWKLESVIQSKVSRKEKNKYHILIHICGMEKSYRDEPNVKAGIKTQRKRMDIWTQGRVGRVGQTGRVALTYIHPHMQNRQLGGSCCTAQRAQLGAQWWPRGGMWDWGWEVAHEWGDICAHVANSLPCTAETNTLL